MFWSPYYQKEVNILSTSVKSTLRNRLINRKYSRLLKQQKNCFLSYHSCSWNSGDKICAVVVLNRVQRCSCPRSYLSTLLDFAYYFFPSVPFLQLLVNCPSFSFLLTVVFPKVTFSLPMSFSLILPIWIYSENFILKRYKVPGI